MLVPRSAFRRPPAHLVPFHQTAAALLLLAVVPAQGPGEAVAWSDYRGPNQDGHVPGAELPLRWSETENVRFKVPVPGTGWSSPVVREGRIWLTTASSDGKEMSVLAFDATTGAKLHQRVLFRIPDPERKNKLNSYASPSPVAAPGRVFVHFGSYGTACLDAAAGTVLWQRTDIPCDHMEGPGSSPILHGDLLVFNADGGDVQSVVALDQKTGETRWQRPRSVDFRGAPNDVRKAFSTPIVVRVDGADRIISTGAKATMAYDPQTGEELWRLAHPGFSMSSRPLARDGMLFLNTGFMSPRILAVPAAGRGLRPDSDVAWSYRRSVARIASAALADGLIYMVSDDGIATCLDSDTGKRVWRQRLQGSFCASPLCAGERVYFFDRDGLCTVVKKGREFQRLARNSLAAGFMASPAVSGDALILRTRSHLYRIESKAPPTAARKKADPWSRFRGPNGDGVTRSSGLPVDFGPEKNLVWKTPLPPGHSSPVLSAERVFLTGVDGEDLVTLCLDRADGSVVWRRKAPRPRRTKFDKRNNPAAPTPAVDPDTVVVFFPEFGLLAYDHDGKEQWRRPLGPFDNEYGMGASPVLFEDRIFLACDQTAGSFLCAVAKKDGEILWRVERPEAKSGHCTPVVFRPKKGRAQLILPGSFLLDSYDTKTGDRIWWVRGLSFEMKSTPVLHKGTVYINGYASPMNQRGSLIEVPAFPATLAKHDRDGDGKIAKEEMPKFRGSQMFFGFVDLDKDRKLNAKDWAFLRAALASENGMLAIRAGGKGDMTEKNILWRYSRSVPQLPSPLLYGGVLYMVNDQGGIVVTLRPANGEVIERGRVKQAIDNYYASPVAADGKVILVSEGGLVSVLPIGGSLEPLAVHDLGERCYATPAIGDGKLYLRTETNLYCFGTR